MQRRVFPFDPMQRVVRVVIGVGLCFTAIGAWLAPFPWATALFGKVVLGEDRVAKRPWGGSIRYDRVRRWGVATVTHYERNGSFSTSRRTTRRYVVVQSTSGWRIRIRREFYRDGDEMYDAFRARLGEPTSMRRHWLLGLRFEEPGPGAG